ncbi:MAG: hypothetical protein EBW82_01580 [Verrucomicrobia bacterium]|nr:hypothetical protein [Verrucomicrobiota bacterium]
MPRNHRFDADPRIRHKYLFRSIQLLLLRAGLARKLTSGLYTFLPLGLRALRKVEKIVSTTSPSELASLRP